MARLRRRRGHRIRYDSNPAAIETDITLWDHVCLEQMLVSRSEHVLEQFAASGIWCLAELAMFRRLWVTDRPAAERIAAIARSMSIPISDEPRPSCSERDSD
jgi:hypothetical protein